MIGYTQTVKSDSTKRTKEFLITTTSLTSGNYGLQYKVKVFKKSFLRLGLAHVYGEYRAEKQKVSTSSSAKNYNSGFSLSTGLEKRKVISESFEFSYGLNLILSAGWTKVKNENPNLSPSGQIVNKSYFISPGIGINLGAIMKIHQNFYLGAEIMPQIVYNYQDNSVGSNGGFNSNVFSAVLNSQNATLAMIYRFN